MSFLFKKKSTKGDLAVSSDSSDTQKEGLVSEEHNKASNNAKSVNSVNGNSNNDDDDDFNPRGDSLKPATASSSKSLFTQSKPGTSSDFFSPQLSDSSVNINPFGGNEDKTNLFASNGRPASMASFNPFESTDRIEPRGSVSAELNPFSDLVSPTPEVQNFFDLGSSMEVSLSHASELLLPFFIPEWFHFNHDTVFSTFSQHFLPS